MLIAILVSRGSGETLRTNGEKILKQGGTAMKRTVCTISALAALLITVSGIPAFARGEEASVFELQKTIEQCVQRIEVLERNAAVTQKRSIGVRDNSVERSCKRDAQDAFGSPYWGFMLDN
jgi:hypothetical protein